MITMQSSIQGLELSGVRVGITDETLGLLSLMVYYISCYKAMGDSVQCMHPTKSIQF